jgi:hypothetical protein
MTTERSVRVSDADREFVAAQLREHYVQGRLTREEFDQRLEAAFAARTRPDLDAVTGDLPYASLPGMLPADRARQGGGQNWGGPRRDWTGQNWGGPRRDWTGQNWAGATGYGRAGYGPGGRSRGRHGFLGLISLMTTIVVVMLLLSVLGFGFGTAPSLWVLVLAVVAAVRWIFRRGRRRRR